MNEHEQADAPEEEYRVAGGGKGRGGRRAWELKYPEKAKESNRLRVAKWRASRKTERASKRTEYMRRYMAERRSKSVGVVYNSDGI